MYNKNNILKCLGEFPKRVNLDIVEICFESRMENDEYR